MSIVVRRILLPAFLGLCCFAAFFFARKLNDGPNDLLSPNAVAPIEEITELGASKTTYVQTASEPSAQVLPIANLGRNPSPAKLRHTEDRLQAAMPDSSQLGAGSCVSVSVDGVVLFEHNTDSRIWPGYAALMYSMYGAVETLGDDYRFTTRIFSDGPIEDGVVKGNLFLVGGGDPVLMETAYARAQRPALSRFTPFESLSEALAQAGITRVNGGVSGVAIRYDNESFNTSWSQEHIDSGIGGSMSSLQLNEGIVGFTVVTADEAASAANATTETASNQQGDRAELPVIRQAQFVENPALYAAKLLQEQSQAKGIIFGLAASDGTARFAAENMVEVARVESAPLGEIVFQILASNDVSAAEMLIKEVAFNVGAQGSTSNGIERINQVLADTGAELQVPARDSSGFDQFFTTSCAELATLAVNTNTEHGFWQHSPRFDLPFMFEGHFVSHNNEEIQRDIRLIGGVHNGESGLVARSWRLLDDPQNTEGTTAVSDIVVVSVMNRQSGLSDQDIALQKSFVLAVEEISQVLLEARD